MTITDIDPSRRVASATPVNPKRPALNPELPPGFSNFFTAAEAWAIRDSGALEALSRRRAHQWGSLVIGEVRNVVHDNYHAALYVRLFGLPRQTTIAGYEHRIEEGFRSIDHNEGRLSKDYQLSSHQVSMLGWPAVRYEAVLLPTEEAAYPGELRTPRGPLTGSFGRPWESAFEALTINPYVIPLPENVQPAAAADASSAAA
jgi:hypothetical protein